MDFTTLLKRPSGLLPIAMSLGALTAVIAHVLLVGTAPQPDEGTAAHVFQLLMIIQLPIIALFAMKWLPREPKHARWILAVQAASALLALTPVFVLGW